MGVNMWEGDKAERIASALEALAVGSGGGGGGAISYVTPEQFGARGDGTTDDTNAIQQALNRGAVMFGANKTYLTTGGVKLNNAATLLGFNTTILCGRSSNTENTQGLNTGSFLRSFGQWAFCVTGINFKMNVRQNEFIMVENATGVYVTNCTFDGSAYVNGARVDGGAESGVWMYNCRNILIESCAFNNLDAIAVSMVDCSDVIVMGNTINYTSRGGIYVKHGNTNVLIAKNRIENTVKHFTAGDGAIDFYGAVGDAAINRRVRVIDNYISGVGSDYTDTGWGCGIRIKTTDDCVVENNHVETSDGYMRYLLLVDMRNNLPVKNLHITRNRFALNNAATAYSVIRLQCSAGQDNFTVADNVFVNNGTVTAACVDLRQSTVNLSITGNDFTQANVTSIVSENNSAVTHTNMSLERNTLMNGIAIRYATYVRFINNYYNNNSTGSINFNYCDQVLSDNNILITPNRTSPYNTSNSTNFVDGNNIKITSTG